MIADIDDEAEAWKPFAHRGELSLVVLSPRRIERMGVVLHKDARLAAIIEPDDGEARIVGFVSAASLRAFIIEMEPRAIEYGGISDDDADALRVMLSRTPDDRTH